MKQLSTFILFIIVLLTTSSCRSSKTNYVGDYLNRKDYRFFTLSEDSTYKYGEGYSWKYSTGKWTVVGRNVILNSDLQDRIALMDVKVTPSDGKYTTLNVNLNTLEKDNKNYISYPILNDNVFHTISPSKYRGSYSASFEMEINSISFQMEKWPLALEVIGMRQPQYYKVYSDSQKIQVKEGDIIDVNLTVPDSLFSYRIFTNYKLKKRGKSLYFKDSEKNRTYKFEKPRSQNEERNISNLKIR